MHRKKPTGQRRYCYAVVSSWVIKHFDFHKLAALLLARLANNHVRIYGSNLAEGFSSLRRRSCFELKDQGIYSLNKQTSYCKISQSLTYICSDLYFSNCFAIKQQPRQQQRCRDVQNVTINITSNLMAFRLDLARFGCNLVNTVCDISHTPDASGLSISCWASGLTAVFCTGPTDMCSIWMNGSNCLLIAVIILGMAPPKLGDCFNSLRLSDAYMRQ